MLEQLPGFDNERRREILRRMELLPIAVLREAVELSGEALQGIVHGKCVTSSMTAVA
jgi:hypothetical protein